MYGLEKYYKDPLYKNSLALIINTALSSLFGLLFWVIATHILSVDSVGLATSALSAAGLIIVLSKLGFDSGFTRYFRESKNINGLYTTITVITVSLSILLAIVFILGLEFFSPSLLFLRDSSYLLIFILYIALFSIATVQGTAMVSSRRSDFYLVQNLLLGIRIPLLFLIAFLGISSIFYAFDVALIVACIFGAFILYRYNGLKPGFKLDLSSLKHIINFSFGTYLSSTLSILPALIMPILIINTIEAENSAYFYIAYSVASLLFVIPMAVSTSLFVEGSHNLPLRETTIKSVKFIALLLVPALLFILLFGDTLLLLFSKDYSEHSYKLLVLLATSSVFSSIVSIYISIKKVQKDVNSMIIVNLLIAVLTLGLGYMGLLKFGVEGVGYAWIAANAIVSIGLLMIITARNKLV